MAGRILHITEGIKYETARWSMKEMLEVYGKIDACHMGDRFNPREHPPWAKYHTREGAEKAMEALDRGLVVCNGCVLRGEWRREAAPPPPIEHNADQPELELTSRDLMPEKYRAVRRSRSFRRPPPIPRNKPARSKSRKAVKDKKKKKKKKATSSESGSSSDSQQKALLNSGANAALAFLGLPPQQMTMKLEDTEDRHEAQKEKKGPMKSKYGTCPVGHPLVPSHNIEGDSCDLCGKKQDTDDTILRCKDCKYNLCQTCVDWGQSLFKTAAGGPAAVSDGMVKPVGAGDDPMGGN